ncbi:BgTH12-00592 [Blumeria graminis f. sp. triticale]|uniref:U3 small nucleolar RNA-associated protein 25 n=1 Tax=Blumeria graminis f. sp. triticale TaxID=1689686 RepID=A0A9W4DNK0_BLUGR|nr:BgTH12-00592 [Blumeria graminis f. sp. triticale]
MVLNRPNQRFASRSRGTGSFAGRGAKYRGDLRQGGREVSRGRARGRGRGRGTEARKRPKFDSARILLQENDVSDGPSENEADDTPQILEVGSDLGTSEDEEDDGLEPVKSYSLLMQSLSAEIRPHKKRRKIEHNSNLERTHGDEEALDPAHDIDDVQEAEEGPETATNDFIDDDDVNDTVISELDPFESHFASPDKYNKVQERKYLDEDVWQIQKLDLPQLGKATFCRPKQESAAYQFQPVTELKGLSLKPKLHKSILSNQTLKFNKLEMNLSPFIYNYQDILYCERTHLNAENLRRIVCLHSLNHLAKTRDRVIKNNAKIASGDGKLDLEFRDQGFTRPKILFLLPTRHSCVRMIKMIISLCEPEQQENRKRFEDSYIDKSDIISEKKPSDFRELFKGNDDDLFRLGLKFTRKTVKYFSQFYNSDMIFASPLGLRMAMQGKEDGKTDFDFLSSIELVVVDQADALLMQNWEHVEYIFDHLNLQPKETHGCDFSRVRSWYLDDMAKYFRQTITLAAFNTPELNTLFFNKSRNWAGKVKINPIYDGAIQGLGLKIKQTFSRLDSASFSTDPDTRFSYFTAAIMPSLLRRIKDSRGTLIFISSYLDFVRVRNYFSTSQTTSNVSFGSISEYTPGPDIARARSHFYSGRHSVLLYTERAHHFRRFQIQGVQKVIMYGLPDNPLFYKEIVGGYLGRSIQEGLIPCEAVSTRSMFSKWDVLKLERIVGTMRTGKLLSEKGDTFDFV